MKIKLIAAHGKNLEIGLNNQLLWKLPTDLKHFKDSTKDKVVVMGERTFLSLPEKMRPLPERKNIVLTLNKDFKCEGVEVFNSIPNFLNAHKNTEEVWIMGGGQIYKQFLPLANELHLTLVPESFEADTFFPEYISLGFKEIKRSETVKNEKDSHSMVFTVWEK
jgi:dihydrofolate reductase